MKQLLLLILITIVCCVNASAAQKQLIDTALNQPAPAFNLKDLSGKSVQLADFKGKILILDFWATWCVPCRNSFPAVKMAMEKYKDDPNVKFLFIDTREIAVNYKALVKTFLTDNHCNFYTVFDEKSDDGKMNLNFKKYKMPGIPAKFYIDAKGIIKYQSLGYNTAQTTEQAALEIEDTIEKVRSGK